MEKYIYEQNEKYIILKLNRPRVKNAVIDKLYLSYHLQDHDTAMTVAQEILSAYNPQAEIWIPRDPEHDDKDTDVVLSGMKAVVFLVSDAFLHTENRSRCTVWEKTVQLTQKTLIIQIEPNMEAEFDRICGHFHLLNRCADNYPAQLKEYIENQIDVYVLLVTQEGSDILDRLFPFRIFVSYRKKDRGYMLEVVKALREEPALYNAAVWYDDALVSGEDYNDQIAQKLRESDLVIFAATDSMTESGNYVLTEEYPQALKEHKAILGVFADGADEASLKACYPLFDEMLPFHDTDRWIGSILRTRASMGKEKETLTPFELYLLALEHEKGVMTVRNVKTAYRLFHLAADKGEAIALERLGKDYYYGNTLEKDHEKSLPLILKAIEIYRAEELTHPEFEPDGFGCSVSLFKLADMAYNMYMTKEQYDEAEQMLLIEEEALIRLSKIGATTSFASLGTTYLRLAELEEARNKESGDYTKALAYYEKAEESLKSTKGVIGGTSPVGMLIELYANRAMICFEYILQGEHRFILPGVRECVNALRSAQQFNSLEESKNCVILAASCFKEIAVYCKDMMGAVPLTNTIFASLIDSLDHFVHDSAEPELCFVYAQARFHAAFLYSEIPDKDFLEQAYQLSSELTDAYPNDPAYAELRDTVEKSLSVWPRKTVLLSRPGEIDWKLTETGEQTARELFLFKTFDIPEGKYGDGIGHFRASGYRCPHCDARMYKAVFSPDNAPRLYIAPDRRLYIEPARVFASPCGRFYAVPQGGKLIDGVFLYADVTGDHPTANDWDLFSEWWRFFNYLGK